MDGELCAQDKAEILFAFEMNFNMFFFFRTFLQCISFFVVAVVILCLDNGQNGKL